MKFYSSKQKLLLLQTNDVQAMPLQSERVSEIIFQQYGDLKFKKFHFGAHLGNTSWR